MIGSLAFCVFWNDVVLVFVGVFGSLVCLLHLVLRQSINRYSTWKLTHPHQLETKALIKIVFSSEKDTVRQRAQKRPAARKRESWCQLRKRAEEPARRRNRRMKTLSRERRVSGLLHRDHEYVVWRDVKCLSRTSHYTGFDSCSRILMFIFINVILCLPRTKWFRSETWRHLCYHGGRTFRGVLKSTSKQPSVFGW